MRYERKHFDDDEGRVIMQRKALGDGTNEYIGQASVGTPKGPINVKFKIDVDTLNLAFKQFDDSLAKTLDKWEKETKEKLEAQNKIVAPTPAQTAEVEGSKLRLIVPEKA